MLSTQERRAHHNTHERFDAILTGCCGLPAGMKQAVRATGGFGSLLAPRRSQILPKRMAEREGFEPPIPVKVCLISSQVHSTALPSLRRLNSITYDTILRSFCPLWRKKCVVREFGVSSSSRPMLPSRDADTAGLSSQWCVPSPSSTGTSSWSLPSLPTRSYRRRNQTPGGNKGSTQRHIIIKRWHVWWGKTANERRGSSKNSSSTKEEMGEAKAATLAPTRPRYALQSCFLIGPPWSRP